VVVAEGLLKAGLHFIRKCPHNAEGFLLRLNFEHYPLVYVLQSLVQELSEAERADAEGRL